jgi:hypothetical protein
MTRRWINTRVVSEWCHLRQRYVAVEKEGYWHEGPVAKAEHVTPALDAQAYRGYDDDAVESSQTAKAAAGANWNQALDENFCYRAWIQETGGGAVNNQQGQLEYRVDTGGGFGSWTVVNTTSSNVRAVSSSNLTNDAATTQVDSSGTYVTVNDGQCEDGLCGDTTFNNDYGANESIEYLYSLQLRSADLNDGDDVQLRVVEISGTTITQTGTIPTITVSVGGDTSITQNATKNANLATVKATVANDVAVTQNATKNANLATVQSTVDFGVNVTQNATKNANLATVQATVANDVAVTQNATKNANLATVQSTVDFGVNVTQNATKNANLATVQATVANDVAVTQSATVAFNLATNAVSDARITQSATKNANLATVQATVSTTENTEVTQNATKNANLATIQATVANDVAVTQNATKNANLATVQATVANDVAVTQNATKNANLATVQATVANDISIAQSATKNANLATVQAIIGVDAGSDLTVSGELATLATTAIDASVIKSFTLDTDFATISTSTKIATVLLHKAVEAAFKRLAITALKGGDVSATIVTENMSNLVKNTVNETSIKYRFY